MGAPRFIVGLLRQAPDKRRLLRSLALGGKGGNRTTAAPDGTELSLRRTGTGIPVVLVHGSLDGMGAFSFVELELASDHEVWVYDRRGRGGSGDGTEYSLDLEAADLGAVISETGGLPHVVAHSYGALIALQARMSGVPMRSLVMYEPPLNGQAVDPKQVADVRRALGEGRVDDAIRGMARGLAGITDDELGIAMAVPPVRKSLRDGVRVVMREIEVVAAGDGTALATTDGPTLIIRGERSSAAVYPNDDQLSASGAEVATLAGQGHLAHIFSPWAFATTVLEFIDRT